MDHIASFFGLKKPTPSKSTQSQKSGYTRPIRDAIVLCHDNTYYDVHFRNVHGGLDNVTVAQLKEHCKKMTGVTMASMKLKVSGAYIKDDTASLRSTGIHDGCIVQVMGEKPNYEQLKQTTTGNEEEVGYMINISKVMDRVEQSKERIEEFDMRVISIIESNEVEVVEKQRKEVEELGISLAELLMQSLITLDGVDCPSEFINARSRRREGVKLCQELMDHVDSTRSTLKETLKNRAE
ncbi:hypothetical protein BDB01DRAFT_533396 [Pilobolus umbonatus]|nr:hypothetical protein BDB01DRAFT_533396 [Pilobolus umbonatus]